MAQPTSPFLALPTEIRLQIYGHLLTPGPSSNPQKSRNAIIPTTEYADTVLGTALDLPNALHIRIIDPQHTKNTNLATHTLTNLRRSKCLIRADRFRARTVQTTYTASNNPGIEAAILATCRQVHAEASQVLYSGYVFDFGTHVEAVGAFLVDLTAVARGFVRAVGIVKRATPYDREFDRCEWNAATHALSLLPSLRVLHLGVVAGKPGLEGWDNVPVWQKADFEAMVKWRAWAGFEWVRELARVNLEKEVKVRAIVEHCPMPSSEGMMFWVGVSRNVEGGFGEWVRGLVLEDGCS
jgi:hypothetical protein